MAAQCEKGCILVHLFCRAHRRLRCDVQARGDEGHVPECQDG